MSSAPAHTILKWEKRNDMKRICAALLACLMLLGCFSALGETEKVDYDLSAAGYTIAYAHLYDMLLNPDAYLGKTVRISGWLDIYYDEAVDYAYLSCILRDPTACCVTGLEFLWDEGKVYPEDYPEYGTPLTVTGRLETYQDGGWEYVHLTDTQVEWENAGVS